MVSVYVWSGNEERFGLAEVQRGAKKWYNATYLLVSRVLLKRVTASECDDVRVTVGSFHQRWSRI